MTIIKYGAWTYEQTQLNGERINTNISFLSYMKTQRDSVEVIQIYTPQPTEILNFKLYSAISLQVFISRIPFTMYEDNLIPLFETIGIVMQFRLMMTYAGRNRGFGYVIYLDPNDSYRALATLNNVLVSTWCQLQLCLSKNTRCLWLTRVDEHMNDEDVVNLILTKVKPLEVLH